ncbi:MAG: hypothetical protein IIX61_06135 [Loktanella sp.]|nr:hypothetical protein [Loktanella sp.]
MTTKPVSACAGAFNTARLKILMLTFTALAQSICRLAGAERALATASGCDPAVDPLIAATEAAREDSLYFAKLLDNMDSPFVFGQVGGRIYQVVAAENFDCRAELTALMFDACTVALRNQTIARRKVVAMVTEADGIIDDLIACYEAADLSDADFPDGTYHPDNPDTCADPDWCDDPAVLVMGIVGVSDPVTDLQL